jgi:hypothetical protein
VPVDNELMLNEYRSMCRFMGLVAVAFLTFANCTRANPRSCLDGSCTDPAFPYCDADGKLEGEPNSCIAVSCTAGELIACREDSELRCNALGGDYELVSCPLGCAEEFGCRLCEPNKIACTNGTLSGCDSNGMAMTSEVCELGCIDVGAACKRIIPSNGLNSLQNLVVDPPKITAVSAVFNADDGNVTSAGQPLIVPTALVPATFPNPAIRVWIVDSIDIDGALFTSTASGAMFGPAVAIVARRGIRLHGTVSVAHQAGGVVNGCVGASPGQIGVTPPESRASGGGGGGNGTSGGRGGNDAALPGGTAGAISGTAELVPLRGGCVGGLPGVPATGGGALQLSTSGLIVIDAHVDIAGGIGGSGPDIDVGGGGAGGSLLLEAAGITITAASVIDAKGGAGFQACATPNGACGAAGAGANGAAAASDGGDVTPIVSRAGGGGGGLGRMRVNVGRRGFTLQPGAVVDAVSTQGSVVIAP